MRRGCGNLAGWGEREAREERTEHRGEEGGVMERRSPSPGRAERAGGTKSGALRARRGGAGRERPEAVRPPGLSDFLSAAAD